MADWLRFHFVFAGGATLAHPLRQIRLIAVSATWHAGGREGRREGGREGGEGEGGEGRGGEGRGGEGRGGEGRGGEGTVHTFHKPEPL